MTSTDSYYLMKETLIGKRYRICSVIGEGGFGITYKGYDTRLGIPVAVKEYYPKGYAQRISGGSCNVAVSESEDGLIYRKGKMRFLNESKEDVIK